jgi:hypothetical protein
MPQIDFQPAEHSTSAVTSIDFQAEELAPSKPREKQEVVADKPIDKIAAEKPQVTETATHKNHPKVTNGETISAAPHHFYDPIVQAFTGPGTAYGVAHGKRTGQNIDTTPGKPVIDFEALHGHEPEAKSTAGKVVQQVVGGAEQFASGLTTPQNVLQLLGTHGLSGAIPLASKLIALGFSYSMLKQAFEEAPVATEKLKKGDIPGFAREMTKIGLTTAFGTKLAMHGSEPLPGPTFEGATREEKLAEIKKLKAQNARLRRSGATAPETSGLTTSAGPAAAGSETTVAPRAGLLAAGETKPPKPDTKPPAGETTSTGGEYYGAGFGALQPFITESVDAMKAEYREMREMQESLERAKSNPNQISTGNAILRYFVGQRKWWAARVNQTVAKARRIAPGKIEGQAILVMRQFKSKPGEIQAFLDGTHPELDLPRMQQRIDDYELTGVTPLGLRTEAMAKIEKIRPVLELALHPTPKMLAADKILTSIAEISLLTGQRGGWLESSIDPDEYVTSLIQPREQAEGGFSLGEFAAKKIGGKFSRRFGYASKRSYPTVIHALVDSAQPRTYNAFDAFTIYGDAFATKRATEMFKTEIAASGMGKYGPHQSVRSGGTQTDIAAAPGIPADWVPFAEHAGPFTNKFIYPDRNGEPAIGTQFLWTPRFIDEAMSVVTDPNYLGKVKGFAGWRIHQYRLKVAELSLSMFHAWASNVMAMISMGPVGWAKGLHMDLESPAHSSLERDGILHNLTTDIEGHTAEAYRRLKPGSMKGWREVLGSAPLVKQAGELAELNTKVTFGYFIRHFKVMDYGLKVSAWMSEHPNATPTEISDAKYSVAKYVNAVYGGLSWETLDVPFQSGRLGINRATVELQRAILLAPDWFFSNVFNVKYAFERGTPAGAAARAFWMKAMVGGVVITNLVSLMYSRDKYLKLVKDPREARNLLTNVYLGDDADGKHIFENFFFRGAPGDAVTLANDIMDQGIEGVPMFAANKLGPNLITGAHLATNENWMHQPLARKGDPLSTQTLGFAKEAIPGVVGVPFSATNAWQMMAGPDAYKYEMPEYFANVFLGARSRHVGPLGTPEEEKKKAAKHSLGTFVPSAEGMRVQGQHKDFVRRIKTGDPAVTAEIDREVDAGRMTVRQRANLYKLAQK